MSEQYRKNVQAMCDRLGIPNPIQEENLILDSLVFYQKGSRFTSIEGTEWNRAGRLFFQEKFSGPGFRVYQVDIFKEFKEAAAQHFAELWDDAETAGRSLIVALKGARAINLYWKSPSPQ